MAFLRYRIPGSMDYLILLSTHWGTNSRYNALILTLIYWSIPWTRCDITYFWIGYIMRFRALAVVSADSETIFFWIAESTRASCITVGLRNRFGAIMVSWHILFSHGIDVLYNEQGMTLFVFGNMTESFHPRECSFTSLRIPTLKAPQLRRITRGGYVWPTTLRLLQIEITSMPVIPWVLSVFIRGTIRLYRYRRQIRNANTH